jgi:hypothetical protein
MILRRNHGGGNRHLPIDRVIGKALCATIGEISCPKGRASVLTMGRV